MNIESGKLFNVEGLDATGKSTLAKELQMTFNGVLTHCPPEWMKPYRTLANSRHVNVRFLYYALSNLWVDKILVQPLIKRNGQYVFQDRTWLTTLTAHEDMGVSPVWLDIGLKIAKRATRPNIAFIMRADNEVRRRRMMERGTITADDLESLHNQDRMEQRYVKWADHLGWNTVVFDNTHHSPEESRTMLIAYITGQRS